MYLFYTCSYTYIFSLLNYQLSGDFVPHHGKPIPMIEIVRKSAYGLNASEQTNPNSETSLYMWEQMSV